VNLLAIHGLNVSATSSDFLISVELNGSKSPIGNSTESGVSANAIRYAGPIALSESTLVKSRTLSGSSWSALNEAVFAVGPVSESLRISEIMYRPADDPNAEYIELTNIGGETLNLNLVELTNGVDFVFPSVELASGDYLLVVRDVAAFEARYGQGFNIAGQYSGSLNNAGERIELQDAAGQTIHDFRYQDNWYDVTDGQGFSLTVGDPLTTDPNAWDQKATWRPSAENGGSPGSDDAGVVPLLGSVVINELLANSEAGTPDWIELHNTTDQAINLGGWFLSDDADVLTKYEIPAGTVIAADGYAVFYEDQSFGSADAAGCHEPFALSRNGETVYLHSGSAGQVTGYSEEEKFAASPTGVSLGRYRKSTGSYNFVALSQPTPGLANATPMVGPVVITEIMYNPSASADAEYVELLNISATPMTLYDVVRAAPWRFTDDPGIELLLPSDEPVTLASGEYLVLARNLLAFNMAYTVPADLQVLEWGDGKLSNGGDKIQLSAPGDGADESDRSWFRVDRVVYSDGSHPADFPDGVDPWPLEADGQGQALTRIDPTVYGNDPANWHAASPSPGMAD